MSLKSRYLVYFAIYGLFHGCYYAAIVACLVR